MKLIDIINEIEKVAPLSIQEDWDNCGYQIKLHNDNDDIKRVLTCLEITSETLDEAISNEVELIITHHPLFFVGINQITIDTYNGKFVKELIKNNISVYSSHTAFDICDGGNNDCFGKILGFDNISKVDLDKDGIMRCCTLKNSISLSDLICLIEDKLNINKTFFNYSGPKSLDINKISWVTGSGSDYMYFAKDIDSDIFITGDLSYHKARDAKEINIPILAIGHYASENIFNDNMKKLLNLLSHNTLNVISSKLDINPYTEI